MPPPRDLNGAGPLVILLDLSQGDYHEVLDGVCKRIRDFGAGALIKGGSLIEPPGQRQGVRMSPFVAERGRILESESRSRDIGANYAEYGAAFNESRRIDSDETLSFRRLFGNWPECISISEVEDSLTGEILDIARRSGALLAAYRWSPRNPAASRLLWRQLILTRVVSAGRILQHYEEIPIDLITNEATLEWVRDRDPWEPADGFFFDDSMTGQIYPENLFRALPIPPDLETAKAPSPPLTPLQRVLRRAGRDTVLRIGGMDDPLSPGSFNLPRYDEQYPDVVASEKRLIQYSLNPNHPANKWEGFAHHGWGSHPYDATRLAAYFCSALLGQFRPIDVSVTADGAIHFGVNIVVPSRRFVYMPTTTAWLSEPNRPLRLTTAFVTSSDKDFDPSGEAEEEPLDWDTTVTKARTFGRQMAFEPITRAAPRLFIQRMGRANELAKALVRSGDAEGDYERAPLGRTILISVGEGLMPWAQASRTASYAQIDLALKGVRSRTGTWVD